MAKIIHSFNEIQLTNNLKTLVLCDIDETVLYYPGCNIYCELLIKEFCPDGKDDPNYDNELIDLKNTYRTINKPSHTDYEGFVSMIEKINEIDGELMFLTARGSGFHNGTKKHLKQIGVNQENFKIHYTGAKISKGEYIKRYIDLTKWEQIIFIDDYDTYLQSVMELYPEIICYKFIAKY